MSIFKNTTTRTGERMSRRRELAPFQIDGRAAEG
jgi:hypothetical protein